MNFKAYLMSKQVFVLGVIVVGLLQPAHRVYTQTLFAPSHEYSESVPYESDVLAARPVRYFLAIGAGAMAFQHLGDYSPLCDCRFSGEKGFKPLFAVEFSIQYPRMGFSIKNMFTYQDVSAEFSRKSMRKSVVVGDNPDIDVEYLNTSNVKLKYISLITSFAWYFPYTQIFLYGGAELGYPLKANWDHVETILTKGVTYYNGDTKNILLPEGEIPGGKKLRIALAVGLGFDIILSSRIYITPQLGANYPITPISSEDSDWKVVTEYGMIFLKVRFL